MIKIIYTVEQSEKESETHWLREQKIFPAIEDYYNWQEHKSMTRFGVIVSPEAAIAIKLRHKLDLQTGYSQR